MKTPKGRDWFENNKETLKEGVLNSLSELRRLNAFEKLRMFPHEYIFSFLSCFMDTNGDTNS